MHSSGVDSHGFLSADIRTILEVTVLPFLLRFQVEA